MQLPQVGFLDLNQGVGRVSLVKALQTKTITLQGARLSKTAPVTYHLFGIRYAFNHFCILAAKNRPEEPLWSVGDSGIA